ncbi:MAG: hypothetical protein HOE35_07510 [Candidatus Ruthia sp.]|jgi:hypothetical protein|nr:hypothetical protein [Candidatus Ruthturnera sp.]
MNLPEKYFTGKWLWIFKDPVDNSFIEEEYPMTYEEALDRSAEICCELWTVVE